jgi:hypothetical protein
MCSKTVAGHHCFEAYVVFHSSNIGIVGSNPIQCLEVHLCFSLLVLRRKGSVVQGVLPNVNKQFRNRDNGRQWTALACGTSYADLIAT